MKEAPVVKPIEAPRVISEAYLPLAIAALALASYPSELLAMTAALIATLILGLKVAAAPDPGVNLAPRWGLLLVMGLAGLGLVAPTYLRFPHPDPTVFVGLAIVLTMSALLLAFSPPKSRAGFVWLTVVVLVVVGSVGFLVVRATAGFGIDVVELHYQAANVMSHGVSPYGAAVEVINGSPVAAPGSTIVGYPYPPVTAVLYAIPVWSFNEPRWTGLAAWLVFLAILAFKAIGLRSVSTATAFLALAALPAWIFVMQAGWTEILTLGLLAAAIGLWEKHPLMSSILFGLAMATKQYFLVLLPLLVLHPQLRGRRSMLILSTVAVTIIPLAIFDPAGAWHALVGFHATTPPRPDSANLVGLLSYLGVTVTLPLAFVIGLPLLVASLLARRGKGIDDLLISMAVVLSIFFMFSSQAFANYWFLLAGLCGLAWAFTQGGPAKIGAPSHVE